MYQPFIQMASRGAESIINCGYARVSIRTLTRSTCDKSDERLSRTRAFRKLFAVVPNTAQSNPTFKTRKGGTPLLTETAGKSNIDFVKSGIHLLRVAVNTWQRSQLKTGNNSLSTWRGHTPCPTVRAACYSTQISRTVFLVTSMMRMPLLHNTSKLYNSR